MAEQNPEIKITDQCCHITVLALCVPWLCSCHLHWGNLSLFTHILPILQCLDKLTSQDMWQLGHSQSSGHLSCGQLAARHRNNILGHLSPFLARPDLTSRIPFTPTKEPGYCPGHLLPVSPHPALPWGPLVSISTVTVGLRSPLFLENIGECLLLGATMCLRNTNGFCGLWVLDCLKQHRAAAALTVSLGAYGNTQNLYSSGISCCFQCCP